MHPARIAPPRPGEVRALNDRLSDRRISVAPPEWSQADGLWEVRIRTADGFVEFARGPSAGHAWRSALVFLES